MFISLKRISFLTLTLSHILAQKAFVSLRTHGAMVCGTVDSAVASNVRATDFESSHWWLLFGIFFCQLLLEMTKNRPNLKSLQSLFTFSKNILTQALIDLHPCVRRTQIVGKGTLWVTSFIYKYKTSTTYPLYETTQCFVLINKWHSWVQSALPTIHLYQQSGYNLG